MAPKPSRHLTILGQDPSVKHANGRILTAQVTIPNEQLSNGPRGYRVQVVDYDASTNKMYEPLDAALMGSVEDPLDPYFNDRDETAEKFNARLLEDPRFHAQNAYAIVMRTLSHFERALGRRISWSFGGHQLKVAPHAFAEANAFYSPRDEGLLFGYFPGKGGELVYNCLSHDIVAHETTHALVDGLRPRYMEPSSPDQAAFHEGFADVVALLSVFSIPEALSYAMRRALSPRGERKNMSILELSKLTIAAVKRGVLLGLGEQFGLDSGVHGTALRRSVEIKPSVKLKDTPDYLEEHQRGELLVAAVLDAFVSVYRARLQTLGKDAKGRLPRQRVAEEGADIADRMLTMAIRALDYMPPTDISFGDYLSALLTSDLEIRPDDSRYGIRACLRDAFARFGFEPASQHKSGDESGVWEPPVSEEDKRKGKLLNYCFVHQEGMQRDRDEVFRFLWDNRDLLGLCDKAYTEVNAVRPCLRVDQDGFTLRETVTDYVQILTLRADELESIEIPGRRERIRKPAGLADWKTVRLLGGGTLLFNEFGHLKYHIREALLNPQRQTRRLKHLFESGALDGPRQGKGFASLHMRGMLPELPHATKERMQW